MFELKLTHYYYCLLLINFLSLPSGPVNFLIMRSTSNIVGAIFLALDLTRRDRKSARIKTLITLQLRKREWYYGTSIKQFEIR